MKKNEIKCCQQRSDSSSLLKSYAMSSARKEIIFGTKFSRITMVRNVFQSFKAVTGSPSNKQIDSRAILTIGGGLAIVRISTKCCRLIDLTADNILIVSLQ